MQLKRLFSTSSAKGKRGYLDTQKKYEVMRTLLNFAVYASLFIAGYLQTGEKANLLTVVAVLGCLPASKSAVSAVMFLRFKSCGREAAEVIAQHEEGLRGLYDMVFTSYKKNFVIGHLAVRGGTLCGYSEDPKLQEEEFRKHIDHHLKMDGHKDVTIKVFTDREKYVQRLEQLKALDPEERRTEAIIATLLSVSL